MADQEPEQSQAAAAENATAPAADPGGTEETAPSLEQQLRLAFLG